MPSVKPRKHPKSKSVEPFDRMLRDLRNNVREQELFKNVVIGNTMKNRIKRNTKRIRKSHAEENWMQRNALAESRRKWHQ